MHYVDYLDMYSLDFEEFLWANGIREQSIEDIRGCFDRREPVPDAMHQKMMVYYFEKNAGVEMDFFIRYKKTATAVEVKSAEKGTSKSMPSMIQNYGVKHGIKLSTKNVAGNEVVESLPLYMAMFL